ncbi:MAG: diguanylate cyclase [Isosphaeraceae bacterium]|nr:diguanylate cyclase [Isosphaeraceae bacterium]
MRRPHIDPAGMTLTGFAMEVSERTGARRDHPDWAEAKYRGIFEHAVEGIFQSSPDGKYLDANPALARIYGYDSPADLILDLTDIERQLYVDPERRTEFARRMIEHDAVTGFESQVRRRDGSVIWISESSRAVRDSAGRLVYYEGIVEDITGRKRAEEQILALNMELACRLDRVASLRRIDLAIIEGRELSETLDICLEQVINQLNVDGAAVLLRDPQDVTLRPAAQRGFDTDLRTLPPLPPCHGNAGRTVSESGMIHVTDLRLESAESPLLAREPFVTYFAVPLVAKGQWRGVLEVFHRTVLSPCTEWIEFLETLAGQVAIAVDSTCLFHELRRSNDELAAAYDATIDGWSRALDLRDEETEGHSLRVTEMTLRLARAMGIPESQMPHLRRGALLHDIGKMGVPDRILRKPGPLSEEEWRIMRRHPQYAHEMLWPIEFLRPALEIPYCHHERWDGTGYPRGLKGVEIPLVARIFAAVDVWDALRSDRPYRPAWSERRVCQHLRSVAGTHLDPDVVEILLGQLATQSEGAGSAARDEAPAGYMAAGQTRLAALGSDLAADPGQSSLPILVAADHSPAADAMIRTLQELGHEVLVANNADEAWRLVQQGSARLVISDWAMSGIDGPRLCRRIRGLSGHPYVYVIVMTALGGSGDRLECLHAGADDFLTKPLDLRELAARLEIARRILSMQEELEQKNARLAELVTIDALTTLKNRRHFYDSLEAAFALAVRIDQPFSILLLDVDEFKRYNDTFGHPSGDEVLCTLANLLRANSREQDVPARIGGEEFAILLPATDSEGVRAFAERLRLTIHEAPWPRVPVTASFGLATFDVSTPDSASLVEQADRALYVSKRSGRDRVTHHDELATRFSPTF